MNCDCIKLLNKYVDNELNSQERLSLEEHLKICLTCSAELRTLGVLKSSFIQNKIDSNPELFWQDLKARIINEELEAKAKEDYFALDFSNWTKRFIPVPVLVTVIVIVLMNLVPVNNNLIDEYIFGTNFESASALIIEPGSNSGIDALIY